MATGDRRFQNIPGPRELADAGLDDPAGISGADRAFSRALGMPPIDHSLENPAERSFLGGVRLRNRLSLFLLLCLATIFGIGALFFLSDQKLNATLDQMRDAGAVANLIAKIEASTLALHSDSRNFLLSKDADYADNYKKRMKVLASHLKNLHDLPMARDEQKLVTTLNDGVTQHADQFLNIVKIQTLLGGDNSSGLISNAALTAADLQKMFATSNNSNLTGQLAKLRAIETRLQQAPDGIESKNFKFGIDELNKIIAQTDLPADRKKYLAGATKSYQADVEQFTRTQAALIKEIFRLDEINTYLSPYLEALIKFAGNVSSSASQAATSIQIEIRRLMIGGGGGLLLVLSLVGYLLMRSVTAPVEKIAAAAGLLAHGDSAVAIPVLGNYDETGEMANTLTYFRENMAQADRLRKELETQLKLKDLIVEQQAEQPPAVDPLENGGDIDIDDQPPPAAKSTAAGTEKTAGELVATPPEQTSDQEISGTSDLPAETGGVSPLTTISHLITRTSQDASSAASEAERTETMVTSLNEATDKIEDIEILMISISDQMSLLAVQTTLIDDIDDQENLILLDDEGQQGERRLRKTKPGAGQSVGDRVKTVQNGTKRAVNSIQQVGRRIAEVNEVAKEFAAESSKEALEAANKLLRQSEDLRGMLDNLLGKVQPDGHTLSSPAESAQINDRSKEQLGSEGES